MKNTYTITFSPKQLKQINFLKSFFLQYTNKVYIVGGYVRDHILAVKSNDIDIEVHNLSLALFESLMIELGAKGVGKSFYVYKYEDIDISLPRIENKIGVGHSGFDVSIAKDEYTASIRRDFTINALMCNIYTNELLDYHNGFYDIKNKVLRYVNKNSFNEDSLRALRAIRFVSKYNFKIEKKTLTQIKDMNISDLSDARIYDELKRILSMQHIERSFYHLTVSGIFEKLFSTTISTIDFIKISRILIKQKANFNSDLREYYFLFILRKYLNINTISIDLPRRFKFIGDEKFIGDDVSELELYVLALDKSISEYLSCTSSIIVNKAKRLGIYKNKFSCGLDIQSVIKDGYKKEAIKIEFRRRETEFIKNKLCLS